MIELIGNLRKCYVYFAVWLEVCILGRQLRVNEWRHRVRRETGWPYSMGIGRTGAVAILIREIPLEDVSRLDKMQ